MSNQSRITIPWVNMGEYVEDLSEKGNIKEAISESKYTNNYIKWLEILWMNKINKNYE